MFFLVGKTERKPIMNIHNNMQLSGYFIVEYRSIDQNCVAYKLAYIYCKCVCHIVINIQRFAINYQLNSLYISRYLNMLIQTCDFVV